MPARRRCTSRSPPTTGSSSNSTAAASSLTSGQRLVHLRLSDPHRVANKGTADRVHMVVDLVVNDWLAELLRKSEAA